MRNNHLDDFLDGVDAALGEACSTITQEYRKTNADYDEKCKLGILLSEDLKEVLDGTGAISLTADEHEKLKKYITILKCTGWMETQHAYLAGMKDRYVIPKMLGLLPI